MDQLKTSTISIGGADVPASNVTYKELESYSDLNFLFGLGYRHNLGDNTFLNFGAIFSPKSPLNGSSELSLIRLSNSGGELETVEVGTENISFDLPKNLGFGFSYEKLNKFKQDSEPQGILWGCLDREIKVQEKII